MAQNNISTETWFEVFHCTNENALRYEKKSFRLCVVFINVILNFRNHASHLHHDQKLFRLYSCLAWKSRDLRDDHQVFLDSEAFRFMKP
ncbi:hypothetical protein J6590_085060 [Homalodisca vitripennis]|nr:hypothetical protein J6590_085060 [Homalodisca vitripennis]